MMLCPIQTPAETRPRITYNIPTTQTEGSDEIERFLTALKENRFVPFVPTDEAHPLSPAWKRLEALYDLEENWNGYDVPAPNPDAIEHAKAWLQDLYLETKAKGQQWLAPHVAANEEGAVAFEWAKGKKRLVVYIGPEDAWYVKAWGPSVLTEMTDGEAETTEERLALWSWLLEP